jgi:hypothetical protein
MRFASKEAQPWLDRWPRTSVDTRIHGRSVIDAEPARVLLGIEVAGHQRASLCGSFAALESRGRCLLPIEKSPAGQIVLSAMNDALTGGDCYFSI